MATPVDGTFTAGDQRSTIVRAKQALIYLTFAGSGTVLVQVRAKPAGTWRTIGSYTATTADGIVYDGPRCELSLLRSAHTGDVTWEIFPGD